jgi:osmotically-inducible protein OsmY
MRHRHEDPHGERQQHPGEHALRAPHYAGRRDDDALYDGLPAVTNREWGEDRADDRYTYGYEGQGGYGRSSEARGNHQGGLGESQGRHAQSGQSRGGVAFGGHERESRPSRGLGALGHRGRGPRDYVRPDDRIVDDVIGRLTDDEYIDASEILVMAEDGVVTLSGNVPERRMKHRAEDLVADASGVRDVHNRIRVDDGSASAGRPGESVRSGRDQLGSGFSSSGRPDPVYDNPTDDSNWPGY